MCSTYYVLEKVAFKHTQVSPASSGFVSLQLQSVFIFPFMVSFFSEELLVLTISISSLPPDSFSCPILVLKQLQRSQPLY